eukprot:409504-Alexandrium_andersonii.AAC.1
MLLLPTQALALLACAGDPTPGTCACSGTDVWRAWSGSARRLALAQHANARRRKHQTRAPR